MRYLGLLSLGMIAAAGVAGFHLAAATSPPSRMMTPPATLAPAIPAAPIRAGNWVFDPERLVFEPVAADEWIMLTPTPALVCDPLPSMISAASLTVNITLVQRTWLRVIVDGVLQHQGVARPGDVWQFAGQESIGVRASNAAALDLRVNTRRVAVSGARGRLFHHTFYLDDDKLATVTPTPIPTLSYMECRWNWATRESPEITEQLITALDEAEIPYTEARAYAFGEDCFDQQGEIQGFATRETDFDITLAVDALADFDALGDLAADVLTLLVSDFSWRNTPGLMPGRILLVFVAGDAQLELAVQQDEAWDALIRNGRGAALLAALGMPGVEVPPTPTPTAVPGYACYSWNWATQELLEITEELIAVLDEAEIPYTEAGAASYGENCLDAQGEVQYFAAMETDFYITLEPAPLPPGTLEDALGDRLADLLTALLDTFPPDATPGPEPGYLYLTVTLPDGSGQIRSPVRLAPAEEALRQGLRGAALFAELITLPGE